MKIKVDSKTHSYNSTESQDGLLNTGANINLLNASWLQRLKTIFSGNKIQWNTSSGFLKKYRAEA
jgi:hypothetical protein